MAPSAQELLASLCTDLRQLRAQAGGPSLRVMAGRLGLGKSQLSAILNGQIRRPPDWQVVAGLVECIREHAVDNSRTERLSLRTGLAEHWRPRFTVLEYAFSAPATGPTVGEPHRTGPVPAQLPVATAGFVGRSAELNALDAALAGADDLRPGYPIVALTGTAGVGKTALAVHWAHRAAVRFPDGQLHLDLRGHAPGGQPVEPHAALGFFLAALGVPAADVPSCPAGRTARFRSLIAGRRVLLVLDNARDAEQVRPLLPGAPGCMVVITARCRLTPLTVTEGARTMTLDPLTADEAWELLEHRLGRPRTTADRAATEAVIDGCARLPAALAIAAGRAAGAPVRSLRALAEELRAVDTRLDVLRVADGGPFADMRAVLSWSYRTLSSEAARLLRLIACRPEPDLDAATAAYHAELPPDRIRPLLAELLNANLLVERPPGRYTCHDLLRSYAAGPVRTAGPAFDDFLVRDTGRYLVGYRPVSGDASARQAVWGR
ncbi:hypothetical protein Val02_46520 [Virgisporangium aliadipatigenens]|uniref:Uncharacterized protein n=1 Tax=Virgisporangium aliadipatigenens TaxID=741659 RepID=A0A8J3YPZ3_9ACTN|nr:NB-ARC domain-containing protein [Virgisporangium aliadipatigenens]GIJ47766.1 hypothetical protein Val02_46520 [Virgisporangium aliadipatigenens]